MMNSHTGNSYCFNDINNANNNANSNECLEFAAAFKYLCGFVQNDVSQDKELNRCIGLAAMNFG